ncbi:MAG: hypothetical protein J6I76_08440 [Oribacterium sp.]|nr:hypothetical protein [Oribacterium sp.]
MKNNSGGFLNVIRWIIAAFMWLMALGTLAFGGVGILGGILFAVFGFIVSPLSSKFLFPKLPNLKKSHKILGAAGIWLIANIFMFAAVPSSTDTDLTTDISTVAESSTEVVERSMPSVISNEESSEDITMATTEEDAVAEKTAEEEAASKKAAEEAEVAKKAAEEEAEKKAAEEAEAKKAEEAAAQKAAEEAAAQKAAEEAAAQKAAEEAAAQKAAEEAAAAQKAAEEAAAQQAAQQVDKSTVANGTESPNALAVLQMGPTTGSACWVPRNGGKKYHSNSSCSGMDDPIYTTVDTATACGFDACKKCH